jgi:CDP-diglyceride synthetase
LTILVFDNHRVVMTALGFLILGDTAAALGGKKWGKHPWPWNPDKTLEGSACFALVSFACAMAMQLRWPVAALGAVSIAILESRKLRWNDNLWLPFISGLIPLCFEFKAGETMKISCTLHTAYRFSFLQGSGAEAYVAGKFLSTRGKKPRRKSSRSTFGRRPRASGDKFPSFR